MPRVVPGLLALLFVGLGCSGSEGTSASREVQSPAGAPVAEAVTPDRQIQEYALEGSLRIVSTKNDTVEVAATLGGLGGRVQVVDPGQWTAVDGEISIPLVGWDSQNELRDSRILETFFQSAEYPEAVFRIGNMEGTNPALFRSEEGSSGVVRGQLAVGGGEAGVEAHVRIRQDPDSPQDYLVESEEALVLSIESLGLGQQLAALITLCGHASVLDAVSVEFKGRLRASGPDKSGP